MAHAKTVIVIDPLEPIRLLEVGNMLDNEYWRWCADEVMTDDGEIVPDDQLTYENFEMGPDFMLPAGTQVRMDYLWGWLADNGGVSTTADYTVTLPRAATVSYVVYFLLSYYHGALNSAGAQGRFFFIEEVTEKDGWVEIIWGT